MPSVHAALLLKVLAMQAMIDTMFDGGAALTASTASTPPPLPPPLCPSANPTSAPSVFEDFEKRTRSYQAAMDVLSGRFPGVKKAVEHQDNWGACRQLTTTLLSELKGCPAALEAAKLREHQRKTAYLHALSASDGIACRQDPEWLESKFDHLMTKASSEALRMPLEEQMTWRWTFERAPRDDRRYFAYKFQYAVYKGLVGQAATGAPRLTGGAMLLELARRIFSNEAYSTKHIKNMVAAGREEPEPVGAPTSMPRAVESVLFRLASKLRSHRLPVYKSLIIYHAQQAIGGTRAALNFAQTSPDGEYILDDDGGLLWDYKKLDHWVYRRFIGDRRDVRSNCPTRPLLHSASAYLHTLIAPHASRLHVPPLQEGAATGSQVILDVHRARWHSFEAMEPYFRTHVQALVDEGIAFYNENYDEDDVDEEGVPKEPIAYWFPEEKWR